jgi:hypothetical protein
MDVRGNQVAVGVTGGRTVEKQPRHPRPIRVRERDLATVSGIRRLVARICDSTSRGILTPAKAQAMLVAIRTYSTTMEVEAAEKLAAQLTALNAQSPQPALTHDHGDVIDIEVVA